MSGHVALLAEGLDPARGGAERAVRAVAEALARRDRDVRVYTPADRAGPPLERARVVPVSASRLRPRRDLEVARSLARAARDAGASRVLACGKLLDADAWWPHGGVHAAAREAWTRAGRSVVAGTFAALARTLRPTEWALDAIEAQAADACRAGRTRCVAISGRVARDLARAHALTPAAVVRNGVDPARFAPPTADERQEAARALAARAGASAGAPLLLFVGHHFRLKGLDLLLAAAARVLAAHVVVVGAEDATPWQALARRLGAGGRVSFLGAVADVAPLYRGASLLVHPSRYDPCSLVVLEALACGLPAIASPEDGSSELVRDGENGGVVLLPEDVDAWAEALRGGLEPKRLTHMREGAAASRRTWDDVAGELLGLLP